MSRPKLSVPNQCSALGPRSIDDVCSVGSNGANHGAKIATKTISAMARSAAVPMGLLLASWPICDLVVGRERAATARGWLIALWAVAILLAPRSQIQSTLKSGVGDAWIEPAIDEINHQVHQHEKARENQDVGLNLWVISLGNRLQGQRSDSRQPKDCL